MQIFEKKDTIEKTDRLEYYAVKVATNIFINQYKITPDFVDVENFDFKIDESEIDRLILYERAKKIIEKDLLSDKRMYNAMVFLGVLKHGNCQKYSSIVKVPYIEIYYTYTDYIFNLKGKLGMKIKESEYEKYLKNKIK